MYATYRKRGRLALVLRNRKERGHYRRQFKRYLRMHGLPLGAEEGESAYVRKWKQLHSDVDPYSYRFFSRYCGRIPEIVPEGLGRTIIEEKLNPEQYRAFYEDKAAYDLLFGAGVAPRTVASRTGASVLLDGSYRPLACEISALRGSIDADLILKPSVDSGSGKGVMLFRRNGTGWAHAKDPSLELTNAFLMSFGPDFVLQEAVVQHPGLAKLNDSSVNTLRIAVYRSVKDEKAHVLAAIVRIGRKGEFVDNAHAGGMFVGIDVATGMLKDKAFDQYGYSSAVWNDLDLSAEQIEVPHWRDAVSFVEKLAERIHHMRLMAFDVTIDAAGCPHLIEYNLSSFSYWLFMMTDQKPLGEYTDEIIDYCK